MMVEGDKKPYCEARKGGLAALDWLVSSRSWPGRLALPIQQANSATVN